MSAPACRAEGRELESRRPSHSFRKSSLSCLLATRSANALPITDRLQAWSAWRAEGADIAHGWLAEQTAVFAIELSGAFVSDFKGGTGGIQTIHEHAFASCLQAKLLLILKRTHGGERTKMVVQCRDAHPRDVGEIFHAEGLREVRFDPGDGLCRAVALIS